MPETKGKKEDFLWAVLTAGATTLAVKIAEWAIEESRGLVAAAKRRRKRDRRKDKTQTA